MRAYLKSLNVWNAVESGWTRLDRAIAEWTRDEKNVIIANDKAVNFIFISISTEEFSRISRCEMQRKHGKHEITHEGTKIVRSSKL